MIEHEDSDHPVVVVIGGQYADMLHELNDDCPALDLVGLSSCAQRLTLPEDIAREDWKRPQVVTTLGPRGHGRVLESLWNESHPL